MRKQMHMSPEVRAKQFMPFAALRGYEKAIREKQMVPVPRKELTEEYKQELNHKLQGLNIEDEVVITYYKGGTYKQKSGKVKIIDPVSRYVKIEDLEVSTEDIMDIVCDEEFVMHKNFDVSFFTILHKK